MYKIFSNLNILKAINIIYRVASSLVFSCCIIPLKFTVNVFHYELLGRFLQNRQDPQSNFQVT